MGLVSAAEYVSVDGVMEDPGGAGDFERGGWTPPYWSDELGALQAQELFAADALLLGRVTYEGFAKAWPSMEEATGEFGKRMNSIPKYVATNTLSELQWNATPIEADVPAEVARLKQQHKLLIYGSGRLVNLLFEHDLVDRLRLMVHPVVVGDGKRLFDKTSAVRKLRLMGQQATPAGVLVVDYESAR